MGKTTSEAQKLADRMRRVAVDATKTAKALNSIGKLPDVRPGFVNAAVPAPPSSSDQQFGTMARRLGL